MTIVKSSGLGQSLFLDGNDLSGDVGSLSTVHGGPAALVVTGLDKSGVERIGGLIDASLDFGAYFNEDGAHPVLSALPTSEVLVMAVTASALGAPAACLVADQVDYPPTRAADGALSLAINAIASGTGIQWAEMLTAGWRTDTTGTTGATQDDGADIAPSSFGLSAYLQVFSTNGDLDVKIQDSANGTQWLDLADAAFTTVAAGPTAQRIVTGATATVRQYLRVVSSGTFTSAIFAVAVMRALSATVL